MRRTEMLQEIRKMRFEEVYGKWQKRYLSQEETFQILGVRGRTFRREICRYEENGLEGLNDKRLTWASHRRAPVEVMKPRERDRRSYRGWNVKHFYSGYIRDGGKRSYTWVKTTLQKQGLVPRLKKSGMGPNGVGALSLLCLWDTALCLWDTAIQGAKQCRSCKAEVSAVRDGTL